MTFIRTGVEGLADDLARERPNLEDRVPAYGRALALLPGVLAGAPGRYLGAAWAHRTFRAFEDRPLLLLAALRADARAEGPAHPLHRAFADAAPDPAAVTAAALAAALAPERERVYDALAHRSVAPADTRRAVAWRWPAALAGASQGARPVALAEVGASAGLDLVADALPAPWTFQDGRPVEVAERIHAVARLGLDPAPLDAAGQADADWLRACVFPGDAEAARRLEEALAAFRAARPRPDAPVLLPIGAPSVPARLDLLSAAEPGTLVLAFQTALRDHLDPDERIEYEAGMRNWIAAHPPGLTLWVELEAGPAGSAAPEAAVLVAHVRAPSGGLRSLPLARCAFEPLTLVAERGAAEELRTLLRMPAAAEARV